MYHTRICGVPFRVLKLVATEIYTTSYPIWRGQIRLEPKPRRQGYDVIAQCSAKTWTLQGKAGRVWQVQGRGKKKETRAEHLPDPVEFPRFLNLILQE